LTGLAEVCDNGGRASDREEVNMSTERMSVAEIADVTGANPKTIRAYLRRNHTRPGDAKGARWGNAKEGYALTKAITADLLEHFAPAEDEDAE
jgi:IS30 family transposase